MFGRSKPVVFDPYRGRRGRRGLPAWLWWLVIGLLVGAAGVIWAQQRWLPPRLSAVESAQLQERYAQADADRTRLQAELAQALGQATQLQGQLGTAQQARDDLATRVAGFDEDLAFVIDALPPDPRTATVAVRAARFEASRGQLRYMLALSHAARPSAVSRPLDAQLRLAVTGTSARGVESRVDLETVDLRIASQQVARGQLPLPAGFTPRQVAVRLVDRAGVTLGQRVLLVR